MGEVVVSSVVFSPDGIEVAFMVLPEDVRSDGLLVATRSYSIAAAHPTHGEEVQDITRQLIELVEDVHRGFPDEPLSTGHEDEDELEGMGQG